MSCGKILAIDDEKNIRRLIKNEFSLEGFDVVTAGSGEEGIKLFDEQQFHLVLLDIKLPNLNGIETLRRLKRKSPATEVIMITGYADIKSAVDSIKLGARDYITKPFKLDELITLAKQAIKENQQTHTDSGKSGVSSTPQNNGSFVQCPSPAMADIYDLVNRVAPTDCTVLIQGETGAGKDVLALQIHLSSLRKDHPFITLDCGMLSQNLVESELYGHKKGAFSGASEAKAGLVEKSHKGTLFLDEIGNIDLDVQKKFLRFLETGQFRRVGENKETRVDTRIILATNLNMQDAMKKGTLRSDLFYRMAVISINIPPLKKRPADIGPLTQYFLNKYDTKKPSKKLSPETISVLSSYSWPGNVRELKSVINKVVILSDTDIITPDDLPKHILSNRKNSPRCLRKLADVEKEHIMAVLEETDGNQTKASEILGINRKTLYKKIRKYEIF